MVTEWTLHQEVCGKLLRLWGCPMIDLFATKVNYRLVNFVSPIPDQEAVGMDALLYLWDHKELYVFSPFSVIWKVQ